MTNKAFKQFSKDLISDNDYKSHKTREEITSFNHYPGNDSKLLGNNLEPIKKIHNECLVTPQYVASRTIFKH